ncbi:MAG: hypothetical protein LBS25_00845, partial [Candidatus Symbiothrix sp.]|nr:hypothetical protein [Candidatus Symbiothrix sp.]
MNKINTQKSLLNYRTALVLALTISLLMNLLFLIMFFYGRPPMMRENHPIEHIFRIQDTLVRIVSNFLVTFFIYLLSFKLLRNQWFVGKMGIAVYILLIAVGTVFVSVVGSFLHPFEHFIHNRVSMIFGGLMRNFTVAAVVSLSSLLLYIFEKQQ